MNPFLRLILCPLIAAAAVKAADKPATPAQEIRSLMRRVNAWQIAHPRMKADDRNWERGTWHAGVTEAQRATGDDKFLQQALDWGNLHQWQVGTEGSGANKLFCAMTWVECYLLKKDPAMLKPTHDWLATNAPNSPGGAKVWFGHAPAPFDGPLYSDSLFAMPVFALLAKATGDRKHLDTLDHFARTVSAELFDKDEGLYYRDGTFIGKKTPAGMVQWGQQVGDRPSATHQAESHEYVTGAFLLAASEALRLTEAGLLKIDATSGTWLKQSPPSLPENTRYIASQRFPNPDNLLIEGHAILRCCRH